MGGVYIERCDIAETSGEGRPDGVNPDAIDPEQAERLWAVSAQLTGVDAVAS